MLWLLLSLLTGFAARPVFGQSDVSCLPFYNWTSNSHNQTPCDVASALISVCNNGPFPVDALPAMSHYLGPTLQTANPCQCNTVTYSLMSACGACQGRTYLSWSVWSANCPTVSISTYPEPIPSGISIPGWAYLDVETNDNFDQTAAKDNSNLTESTAIPTSTTTVHVPKSTSSVQLTSTHVFSSSAAPAASSTADSSGGSSPEKIRRENAIGGGIVGGLSGLLLLTALFFWLIKRRRRLARNGQHLPSPSPSPADPENPTWHEGPYMRQANLNAASMSPAVSESSSLAPAPANHQGAPTVVEADHSSIGLAR